MCEWLKRYFGRQSVEILLIEPKKDRLDIGHWLGDAAGYVAEGGPKAEMEQRQREVNKMIEEYNARRR